MSLLKSIDVQRPLRQLIESHPKAIAVTVGLLVLRKLARWYHTITPRNCVLELAIPTNMLIVEDIQPELAFLSDAVPLRSLTHTLEIAGNDPRVKGLVLRLGLPRFSSLAALMELREALVEFKARGKAIVAFTDTFSDFSPTPALFYLASAATRIVMTPLGHVAAIDPFVAVPFVRTMLAKLGIAADLDARAEYKNMKDFFTETRMSPAHREAVESLLNELVGFLVDGIASARGMSAAAVRAIFDSGPHTAAAAKAAGLIDDVAYRDQVYGSIVPAACGLASKDNVSLLFFDKYRQKKSRTSPWRPPAASLFRSVPQVAIIYLSGLIHRGRSNPNLDGKSPSIGSDTACMLIRAAADDKKISGIILRVDSGGGDAVASDLILREVLQARARGKKVVVSMGGVAASGGYYISCGADRIVAMPSTITGSIGVVFGKFVMRELLTDKIGIDYDTSVQTGQRGRLMSVLESFSPEGDKWRSSILDDIYAAFKSHVMAGRKLSTVEVEEVARGRVWTGTQALARKLVDRLGSTKAAIDEMRGLLSLAPGAPIRIRRFPELSIVTLLRRPKNSSEERHHLVSAGASVSGVFGILHGVAAVFRVVSALLFAPSGSGATIVQELLAQSAASPGSPALDTPSSVASVAAALASA